MMRDNVIPMIHVCRNCTPSMRCSACEWLGKLLHQEVTLDKVAEERSSTMEHDDFGFDVGEGAYHSDEENRKENEVPLPDELWEKEFEDID